MADRKLFDELRQGFDALKEERAGKFTLKATSIIAQVREKEKATASSGSFASPGKKRSVPTR